MPSNGFGMNHLDQGNNYSPLSGFADFSKIGGYANTAAEKIQPVPISNVAANYSSSQSVPTAIGSDPTTQPTDQGGTGQDTTTSGGVDTSGANLPAFDGSTFGDTSGTAGSGGATGGGAGTAAGATTGSWWQDILNGVTGGQGFLSSLGSMAPYLADYALAMQQADKQSKATNQTIQPLIAQSTTYLNAATKDLNLYESGKVNPAQQSMIDAYSVSQKAQVAQQLQSQGISDSGARNSADQQIDNNAMMMKQNFVQQSLQNALALEGAGMQPLLVAVQDKLLSDTELAKTMMDLTGSLAQAWAYQQGQAARGSGGGGTTGAAAKGGVTGAAVQQGEKYAEGQISNYLGGSGAGAGAATDAAGVAGLTDMSAVEAGTVADTAAMTTAGSADIAAGIGGEAAAGGGAAVAGSGIGIDEGGVAGVGGVALEATGIGALAYGAYKVGDSYNWWGNNNPSRIGATNVPKGAQQWAAPNGDNIIGIPSKGGAMLAMQVNHGKAPGDPVLYPKGGNAKTGVGGWELKGFRKGQDMVLTNQKTGQQMNINDLAFQQTFGITAEEFQQMYQTATSSYKQ